MPWHMATLTWWQRLVHHGVVVRIWSQRGKLTDNRVAAWEGAIACRNKRNTAASGQAIQDRKIQHGSHDKIQQSQQNIL